MEDEAPQGTKLSKNITKTGTVFAARKSRTELTAGLQQIDVVTTHEVCANFTIVAMRDISP